MLAHAAASQPAGHACPYCLWTPRPVVALHRWKVLQSFEHLAWALHEPFWVAGHPHCCRCRCRCRCCPPQSCLWSYPPSYQQSRYCHCKRAQHQSQHRKRGTQAVATTPHNSTRINQNTQNHNEKVNPTQRLLTLHHLIIANTSTTAMTAAPPTLSGPWPKKKDTSTCAPAHADPLNPPPPKWIRNDQPLEAEGFPCEK